MLTKLYVYDSSNLRCAVPECLNSTLVAMKTYIIFSLFHQWIEHQFSFNCCSIQSDISIKFHFLSWYKLSMLLQVLIQLCVHFSAIFKLCLCQYLLYHLELILPISVGFYDLVISSFWVAFDYSPVLHFHNIRNVCLGFAPCYCMY